MNARHVQLRDRALPDRGGAPFQGCPELLERLYRMRGVSDACELDYRLAALPRPDLLPGIGPAAEILADTLTTGGRILVVGDFDADGATSTAVALRSLRAMGALAVDYLVPDRFELGYGLSAALVEHAKAFRPSLILTVDNGISAHAGVAAANAVGISVIVTDHHLPGASLPEAAAIVNPQLADEQFPARHLAGVGVCFYVMLALRGVLRERGWFNESRPEPNLASQLDLVALGTIADVVPLDHVNRLLVEQGLRRIRAGTGCHGINALLQRAGRDPDLACASDMGFAVAPRLNAAGRLDDMALGIEALVSDSEVIADERAAVLDSLNNRRRLVEREMRDSAMADVEAKIAESEGRVDPVLCLFDTRWHQGVVGIVAGRLKEHFHRPVIAFAPGEAGELKGSARSIAGVHIRDLLEAIDTRTQGRLIRRYGGHAMAAGLQIAASDLEAFQEAVNEVATAWVGSHGAAEILWTDGILPAASYTLETAKLLRMAGPWGAGFPEPLFRDQFVIDSQRIVGESHLKLSVRPSAGSGPATEAIAFNAVDRGWDDLGAKVIGAFRLDVNSFRGRERLQLVFDYLAAAT